MILTQQQYIFIHNAVLEYVVCGQTEITCDNFPEELANLKQINRISGKTKLEDQFEVGISMATITHLS